MLRLTSNFLKVIIPKKKPFLDIFSIFAFSIYNISDIQNYFGQMFISRKNSENIQHIFVIANLFFLYWSSKIPPSFYYFLPMKYAFILNWTNELTSDSIVKSIFEVKSDWKRIKFPIEGQQKTNEVYTSPMYNIIYLGERI